MFRIIDLWKTKDIIYVNKNKEQLFCCTKSHFYTERTFIALGLRWIKARNVSHYHSYHTLIYILIDGGSEAGHTKCNFLAVLCNQVTELRGKWENLSLKIIYVYLHDLDIKYTEIVFYISNDTYLSQRVPLTQTEYLNDFM